MGKNKILIDKGDVGNSYEPSDSEGEYSAHEKKLLQKVRRGRQRNVDREKELLAFNQNNDDDDDEDENIDEVADDNYPFEGDSDMEEENENDGIPDSRAWGKKRGAYYSTDFVDQDYSSYNAREEEMAEQEESEARAIQQRLAKQLEESDFTLDVFSTQPAKKEKKGKSDETILKKDLSALSERQKEQLFKKESPEFDGLIEDFKKRMSEKIEIIDPALTYFSENSVEHPIVSFVKNLNQLILSYCTNVSFYLVLKSKRVEIKNHPIVQRLVKIRQLLNQLDEKYSTTVRPQLVEVLKNANEGIEFTIGQPATLPSTEKKLRFLQQMEEKSDEEIGGDSDENYGEAAEKDLEFQRKLEMVAADSNEEVEEEDNEEEGEDKEGDERRQITYQIAKNKGLTPYRKKELRNPRVKHRNKFRKALIRRKGAVRTVRKEIKRYDGEKFGIKASVKKGIKIK